MAQRRSPAQSRNGEDWGEADSFTANRLKANEQVKLIFGPNQTKAMFLALVRRYGEIGTLNDVLGSVGLMTTSVDSVVIENSGGQDIEAIEELVTILSPSGKASLALDVLKSVDEEPELLQKLVELSKNDPDSAKLAAASLNLARYSTAIEKLQGLVERGALEHDYQLLLESNPWMFGSEYSERLDRRNWVRDQSTDFMMRRTADRYLELIEIKTPIASSLFRYDESHHSWYPSRELSRVVGQVIGYLDEIDADRNSIERKDGVAINKLRAKIFIGLDNDQEQIQALRRFNSHLHRIEIITFDQLINIATRVREHLQKILEPVSQSNDTTLDDVPF
jgi:hypothetical protein